MNRLFPFALAGLLAATPALAQNAEQDRMTRAQAAGYKAQFLCSGLWNGGKTVAQIEADELTGIYDHVAPIVPTLQAEIDPSKRQVRVAFAEDMAPRIAQWRPGLGCAALAIGAGPEAAAALPRLASAPDPAASDARAWPMGDRAATARPSALTRRMDGVVAATFADRYKGKTSAVLIVHRGRILSENYGLGHDLHTSQRTWSVAKSIAGTLIGHGVQQGLLRVEEPARLAAWQSPGDPRARITVDQLMRMASGLTSDTAGNRTDDIYMGGTAVADRSPRWPLLHPPGTHFRYANNDTLLATMALMERLPADRRLAFPRIFFDRIGMTRTIAETDWQGQFILSSQVWTTARDLARLGLLYLNRGTWQGERLLPADWLDFVTRPGAAQPEGGSGYGATFWRLEGEDGIPADAIAAQGNRGQYLVIIPSLDLLVVRRGYDKSGDSLDLAALTRDVVAALGMPPRR